MEKIVMEEVAFKESFQKIPINRIEYSSKRDIGCLTLFG